MLQLVSIISIVIYMTYSETCQNTHSQSTFLSISINGPSIDKIVTHKYLDIIKTAASEIIPSAGTNRMVGLQVFAGQTLGVWNEQSLTHGDYSTISTLIDDLPIKYSFEDNVGNDVSNALDHIINIEWIGQRYHILFSAGNPTLNLSESTCRNAVRAKQNNIQTYVVLIGTQRINYIKEFYSCLVEDVAKDIIEIDPNKPTIGIQKLFTRVCKTNGIDFKITEVNPIDDASSYRRFIEVYNRGANTSITVCFKNSIVHNCAYGSVSTGEYFVAYGGSIGIVPTQDVGVTVAAGLGASIGSEGWIAIAMSRNYTDTVIHTRTNGFQNQVTNPRYRSYALRAIGFNNNYGLNWRMTCGNVGATPGAPPLDKCIQGATCTTETCSATSQRIEQCDSNNNYCECSSGYFSDGDTCIDKPTVSNTECYGYVVFDENRNKYWTYFVWSMPYDGIISYTLKYKNITAVTDSQAVAIDYVIPTELVGSRVNVQITASVISPVGNQISETIQNLNCTISNSNLTYDEAGVYIGNYGICPFPRCNCHEEARDCCTTMTSNAVDGCVNLFKSIEIKPRHLRNGLQQRIYISKYGNTAETIIFYRMVALGQINQSDFENLTLFENQLKSTSQSMSINPSYIYGNRLNVEVLPIGTNTIYTDMVVISEGSDEVFINFNISAAKLKHSCTTGQDGTTYEECRNTAMAFQLILLNCTTEGGNCLPLYPTTLWISVKRSDGMCDYLKDYYVCGNHETNYNIINIIVSDLPEWVWFLIFICFFVFMCLISRKLQKRKALIARKQSEIIQQEDDEEGFVDDLYVEDAMFSPTKDGVRRVYEDHNVVELDINNYELEGTNDFAHVNAEVFQEEFQVRTIHHDSISLIAPSEDIQK